MIVAVVVALIIGYIAGIASVIWWAHYGFNKPKYWWKKGKEKQRRRGNEKSGVV